MQNGHVMVLWILVYLRIVYAMLTDIISLFRILIITRKISGSYESRKKAGTS